MGNVLIYPVLVAQSEVPVYERGPFKQNIVDVPQSGLVFSTVSGVSRNVSFKLTAALARLDNGLAHN